LLLQSDLIIHGILVVAVDMIVVGIGVTTDRRAVFCVDERHVMNLPTVGSWVIVQVTHIFTPNHICVCFPYGLTEGSNANGGDLLLLLFHFK